MTKQEKEGTQTWTNARLLISHGKRQIFASKQEQGQKRKIVFLDENHFFRGRENEESNRKNRLEKKNLQEELAKMKKRGIQALDEKRLIFFPRSPIE